MAKLKIATSLSITDIERYAISKGFEKKSDGSLISQNGFVAITFENNGLAKVEFISFVSPDNCIDLALGLEGIVN